MINFEQYYLLKNEANAAGCKLIAVSKTKPVSDIKALYAAGERCFGENYAQELATKAPQLPDDIEWHFIGHLQTNKVKQLAPFVHTIHGIDSLKLLEEINKQAAKHQRTIVCLLQIHVAAEETKFGLDENEVMLLAAEIKKQEFKNVTIGGIMGMASNTDNTVQIRSEFKKLKNLFDVLKEKVFQQDDFKELSMGMSSDYQLAIEAGSTMIRVGSLIFGERNYAAN